MLGKLPEHVYQKQYYFLVILLKFVGYIMPKYCCILLAENLKLTETLNTSPWHAYYNLTQFVFMNTKL